MKNLSLSTLKTAYQSKQTTPRELLFSLREQALAQADHNVWITLLDESTLDTFLARLSGHTPQSLPLYGVPFAIKDNIDLIGVPTTAACPDFSYMPTKNAFVVQQLLDAGAIPLGKTNMDQFATGLVGTRSPYGQTKNAFNPEYISGGSSAGSAVAVSLAQVSFSLGTDTAGSGRVPAALNNVIGMKPTKGLLSTSNVVPACRSLDCVSIFALNCDDAATLFDVCAKYDRTDTYARKNAWRNRQRYYSNQLRKRTDASMPDPFVFGIPDTLDFQNNTACEHLFDKAVSTLEKLGGRAQTISFFPFSNAAKLLYEGPWVAERQAATENVNPESLLPIIRDIINNPSPSSAKDAFKAFYTLSEYKTQCDEILAEVDFVLTPTTPTQFTRKEIAEDPVNKNSILGTYTNFMNLLDYCTSSVPVGICDNGVPWGVSLFSSAFHDINVLSYAAMLHRHIEANPANNALSNTYIDTSSPDLPVNTTVDFIVCGAHLEGQALNWQLTDRQAVLVKRTKSSRSYQLWALPDRKRPAMVRNVTQGTEIDIEVWRMPEENFGSFVKNIPAPLGIGKVETQDGDWLPGFICDISELNFSDPASGLVNISAYGGWRAWLDSIKKMGPLSKA